MSAELDGLVERTASTADGKDALVPNGWGDASGGGSSISATTSSILR